MENPNIKTEVKHSESKPAWNIICTNLGVKRKVARLPYIIAEGNDPLTEANKNEALRHADFINFCFNNSDKITQIIE